jgi:adenosylcobinamide-phosphate synthase
MEPNTLDIIVLLSALIADSLFGDPIRLPHLTVFYGKIIRTFDKAFNRGNFKITRGGLVAVMLICCGYTMAGRVTSLFYSFGDIYGIVISAIILFYSLANRTLITEGKAVFIVLEQDGLEAGQKQLARIVGRDTRNLSENQVKMATLETMSENLSDGVIAPLFYFFILGIPGVVAYKIINTLDSMIGYRNSRYEKFGKIPAKIDDIANYIPARLTAILMLIITLNTDEIFIVFREGKKHSSPNAGLPEAALAEILDCQFGGPNYYLGELVDKPYIGTNQRNITMRDLNSTVSVNIQTTVLFSLMIILTKAI